MKGGADLHSHTTYSDGLFAPAELVRKAKAVGLAAVAITDHDSTDGIPEAVEEAGKDLEVIAGVELSASGREDSGEDIHILGYFVRWDHPVLREWLALFRKLRAERAHRMIRQLREAGVALKEDGVWENAGRSSVGRMHVARALVNQGFAEDIEDAFRKYLRPGQPGFVAKVLMTPGEAIRLIHQAGGAAALAHPGFGAMQRRLLAWLRRRGLAAIEVYHPHHTAEQTRKLRALAKNLDLVPVGGSDWHGEDEDAPEMLGKIRIGRPRLEALRQKVHERRNHSL